MSKELVEALVTLARENAALQTKIDGDGMATKESAVPPKPEEISKDMPKEALPVKEEPKVEAKVEDKDDVKKEELPLKPADVAKPVEAVEPEPTMKDVMECMKGMKSAMDAQGQMITKLHEAAFPHKEPDGDEVVPPTAPAKEAEEEKPPELPKAPVTEAAAEKPEDEKKVVLGESSIPFGIGILKNKERISESVSHDIREALGIRG